MTYTPDEMMTVAAARRLKEGAVCFVGIGLPSAACNLARLTHAPGLVLIYESGTVGTRPTVLPLSIGDGELAATARTVVPLPEIFTHYLQAGRVDVGFLGAAQIDRMGDLNSTVIGPYDAPKVRLPGSGGAPEIARHAREVLIVMKQSTRSFVERLDFRTTAGRPGAVITDLGVLEPDAGTRELTLRAMFEGVTVEAVRAACGWPLRVADRLTTIAPPTTTELEVLRALHDRTAKAHAHRVVLTFPS
ncbi:MAG: CoA-transferase subunit beta [Gemmatimonadota bacterium]|nr:CoA-transferase subunit beta [Gemmatimonadota bacterium]